MPDNFYRARPNADAQKRGASQISSPAPGCNLTDFDIAIRGDQPPFAVTCTYAGRDAEGEFYESADDHYWRQIRTQLGDMESLPGEAMIAEAGSELYNGLLRGDIRDLWMRARGDLEQGAITGLRLRLAITPPAVNALPWESLYDPDRKLPLAADSRTPLIRAERLYRDVGASRPLATTLPVRLLLAVPDDPSNVIDAEAEIAALQNALGAIGPEILQITLLHGRFGVVELRAALDAAQADILHVIAHGQSDGLLLWQDDAPRLVQSNALRMTLQRTTTVKFVLLNACLAGQLAEDETPFATVGPQLLQAGIPAVIAMQVEITDGDAVTFAHHLYEELLYPPCAGAIDVALANTRSTLYALNPDSFAFGAPVLWLNANQGNIFVLPAHAAASIKRPQPPAPPTIAEARPEPETLSNVDEMEAWLTSIKAEIATLAAAATPKEWSGIYRDWQRQIQDLSDTLFQLRHMQSDIIGVLPEERATKRAQVEQSRANIVRLTDTLRNITAAPRPDIPPAN